MQYTFLLVKLFLICKRKYFYCETLEDKPSLVANLPLEQAYHLQKGPLNTKSVLSTYLFNFYCNILNDVMLIHLSILLGTFSLMVN